MSDPRNFDLAKIKSGSLEWAVFVSARMLADDLATATIAREAEALGTPIVEPGVLDELDRRAAESLGSYRRTKVEWRKAQAEGKE